MAKQMNNPFRPNGNEHSFDDYDITKQYDGRQPEDDDDY